MLSGIKQDLRDLYRGEIGMCRIVLQTGFGPVFGQMRDIPSAIIKPLMRFQADLHPYLIANRIPENFF